MELTEQIRRAEMLYYIEFEKLITRRNYLLISTMVNTECPYCGFDFEASPKRRRKCSSCKEQLYVVKDYYKVVRELLYKAKNELELNPDRYSKSDEYDIYSLRFHLLERLWYAGVLVNDKGDNPALFPGFFSKQINFEMSTFYQYKLAHIV